MKVKMMILLFLVLPLIGCNVLIDAYENLLVNITKVCKQTDERKGDFESSTKHCAATGDYTLLCLPSGKIGDVFTRNCSVDNVTLHGSIERVCSESGEWLPPDEYNHCKFYSLLVASEIFNNLGIDLLSEEYFYEYEELLQKLGKDENEVPPPTFIIFPDEVISENDTERLRLLDLIFGSISCFFSMVGFLILLWLYPKNNGRVNVHRHLFGVLFLQYLMQIIFFKYAVNRKIVSLTSCHVTYFLYAWFSMMVYTWLLNEGLYHFWIIFFPYKDPLKFRYFVFLGYGLATLEMAIHIPGVLFVEKTFFQCKASSDGIFSMITIWDKILWYSGSALLYVNFFIFIYLMVILRKKLKREIGTNTRKSWRFVRSWFILLILLGGGHFFAVESSYKAKYVGLNYFQRTVLGLQGFLIFLSQVLFSSDVKKKIRNKWRIHLQMKDLTTSSISTPMSIRSAASSFKQNLSKLNSSGSRVGSYDVTSLEKKQNGGGEIKKTNHIGSAPTLKDNRIDNTKKTKSPSLEKETVTKQNSLGFDNVGFHKEQQH